MPIALLPAFPKAASVGTLLLAFVSSLSTVHPTQWTAGCPSLVDCLGGQDLTVVYQRVGVPTGSKECDAAGTKQRPPCDSRALDETGGDCPRRVPRCRCRRSQQTVRPHDCPPMPAGLTATCEPPDFFACRKGVIQMSETESGFVTVHAEVPLSNMFGYSTELRSATQVFLQICVLVVLCAPHL